MTDPFANLPRGHYGAILADPPWAFNLWWGGRSNETPAGVPSRATKPHYEVMREAELSALPVGEIAAKDCVLVMWICWPVLEWSLRVMNARENCVMACRSCNMNIKGNRAKNMNRHRLHG